MDVSEAEEIKHLRDENGRLKKLVAELSLDKDMLQSVIRKNSLGSHPSDEDLSLGTPARSAGSGSEALAGGIPRQRAPRLRADGGGEIERPRRSCCRPWRCCRKRRR